MGLFGVLAQGHSAIVRSSIGWPHRSKTIGRWRRFWGPPGSRQLADRSPGLRFGWENGFSRPVDRVHPLGQRRRHVRHDVAVAVEGDLDRGVPEEFGHLL